MRVPIGLLSCCSFYLLSISYIPMAFVAQVVRQFHVPGIESVPLLDIVPITSGKPLKPTQLPGQVPGDRVDHGIAPAAGLLLFGDQPAELSIQGDQLPVDGPRRLKLGGRNLLLQGDEERAVIRGLSEILDHKVVLRSSRFQDKFLTVGTSFPASATATGIGGSHRRAILRWARS